jgi:hypothetical protein
MNLTSCGKCQIADATGERFAWLVISVGDPFDNRKRRSETICYCRHESVCREWAYGRLAQICDGEREQPLPPRGGAQVDAPEP